MKRSGPIQRKRRKPRPAGTGCQVKTRTVCRRDAYMTIANDEGEEKRYCAMHAADHLFGKDIRASLDGRCYAEGSYIECNGGIQCAHVQSRRYFAVRWDRSNARPMCSGHHLFFTLRPAEWEQFCRDSGIDWDKLRMRALTDTSMNPLEVIASYQMPLP